MCSINSHGFTRYADVVLYTKWPFFFLYESALKIVSDNSSDANRRSPCDTVLGFRLYNY